MLNLKTTKSRLLFTFREKIGFRDKTEATFMIIYKRSFFILFSEIQKWQDFKTIE